MIGEKRIRANEASSGQPSHYRTFKKYGIHFNSDAMDGQQCLPCVKNFTKIFDKNKYSKDAISTKELIFDKRN